MVKSCETHTQTHTHTHTHTTHIHTHTYIYIYIYTHTHRVSQEGMSIFWDVIASVMLCTKFYMYLCAIGTVSEIKLFYRTGVWIWRPKLSFTPAVLGPVRFLFIGSDEE